MSRDTYSCNGASASNCSDFRVSSFSVALLANLASPSTVCPLQPDRGRCQVRPLLVEQPRQVEITKHSSRCAPASILGGADGDALRALRCSFHLPIPSRTLQLLGCNTFQNKIAQRATHGPEAILPQQVNASQLGPRQTPKNHVQLNRNHKDCRKPRRQCSSSSFAQRREDLGHGLSRATFCNFWLSLCYR